MNLYNAMETFDALLKTLQEKEKMLVYSFTFKKNQSTDALKAAGLSQLHF